jgi:hypothetical protein
MLYVDTQTSRAACLQVLAGCAESRNALHASSAAVTTALYAVCRYTNIPRCMPAGAGWLCRPSAGSSSHLNTSPAAVTAALHAMNTNMLPTCCAAGAGWLCRWPQPASCFSCSSDSSTGGADGAPWSQLGSSNRRSCVRYRCDWLHKQVLAVMH